MANSIFFIVIAFYGLFFALIFWGYRRMGGFIAWHIWMASRFESWPGWGSGRVGRDTWWRWREGIK